MTTATTLSFESTITTSMMITSTPGILLCVATVVSKKVKVLYVTVQLQLLIIMHYYVCPCMPTRKELPCPTNLSPQKIEQNRQIPFES